MGYRKHLTGNEVRERKRENMEKHREKRKRENNTPSHLGARIAGCGVCVRH